MNKRLAHLRVAGAALIFVLCTQRAAAQEFVEAHDFIIALQEVVATAVKSTENSSERLTKVEMEIGVTYTKDSAGKLKIFAIPHTASSLNTTVHKLTLHWVPQSRGQGSVSMPGAMGSPFSVQPFGPGLTPEQQEMLKETLKEKIKRRPEESREGKQPEEKKTP